jgi:hypothetical protein
MAVRDQDPPGTVRGAGAGEIHPYDVPEILAVPVVEGSQDYLEWLDSVLRKRGDP